MADWVATHLVFHKHHGVIDGCALCLKADLQEHRTISSAELPAHFQARHIHRNTKACLCSECVKTERKSLLMTPMLKRACSNHHSAGAPSRRRRAWCRWS